MDLDALKTPQFIKRIVREGEDKKGYFTEKVREHLRILNKDKPLTAKELEKKVNEAVNAFTEIRQVTLTEDVTVIRYYSKKNPDQVTGPWWTFEKGTRESLAILHKWNKMDGIVVSTIPKNTTIFIGPAASQREVIDKIERELTGGQIQVYWFTPDVPQDAPRFPGIAPE